MQAGVENVAEAMSQVLTGRMIDGWRGEELRGRSCSSTGDRVGFVLKDDEGICGSYEECNYCVVYRTITPTW